MVMPDAMDVVEVDEPDLSSDEMSEGLPLGPLPHVLDGDADASSQSDENDADAEPNTGKRKAGKKLRSAVWKHFTQGPVGPDGAYDATCNYCGVKYQMGNQRSTGSLRHHYKRSCKKMPYSKRHKPDALQKLLSVGTKTEPGLDSWEFNQMLSRHALAKMVMGHDYPFNCVSHHYFKAFIKELQPSFTVPSRNTLRADCLDIYGQEKVNLYEQLGRLDSKCSFTSDLWTNKGRDRGFMAITCHFIDNTWQLRKRLITFIPLPSPHTGKHIADAISEQLVLWNLDKKMFCLVLDNASANDACVREMLTCPKMCLKDTLPVKGSIFHQRCACHILNLIVQDGLATMSDEIKSIRETMKYIRHSQGRMEKFALAAKQAKAPSKKPGWDVPTRWNSTYVMLVLALELKGAIVRFGSFDKNYLLCPSDIDWDNIQALTDCLRVFYEVTMKLSGTHYPTINLFFPEFCEVCLAINKMKDHHSPFIKEMGKSMFDKFDKYWSEGNTLLAIACALDARCKLHVVEYYIKMIVPDDWQRFMSNVKACMNALFGEYLEAHIKLTKKQSRRQGATATASTSATDTRTGLKNFISGKKSSEPAKSELEEYFCDALDDAPLDEHFDIISWWKLKAPKYPVLAKMVRDILAVPISTVASESVFSTSGRILSPTRNALNNESIETLVCSQDWLRAFVKEKGGEIGDPLWCFDDGGEVGPDGLACEAGSTSGAGPAAGA